MKVCIPVVLILLACSCSSNFKNNYQYNFSPKAISIELSKQDQNKKITFHSVDDAFNPDPKELNKLMPKGYLSIGFSNYTGPKEGKKELNEVAQDIQADVVLFSNKPLNENKKLYDNRAMFFLGESWCNNPKVGFIGHLEYDEKKMISGLNQGIFVEIVCKGGPASKANLKVGDFIVKVNNEKILKEEDVWLKIDKALKENTKIIKLSIFRKGEQKEIKIKPNYR